MLTSKKLREERANKAELANAILKDSGEAKSLSPEKEVEFNKIHADIEALGKQIDAVERHEKIQAEMAESRGVAAGRADAGAPAEQRTIEAEKAQSAFSAWLRGGIEGLNAEQRSAINLQRTENGMEVRAPQTVTTTGGGHLIKQDFSNQLEVSMKAFGNVEAVSDVFETDTGATLPWPTVDDTAVSGRLLAINTAATETAVTYGVTNFAAYKFSSDMVTVPVELMQDSAFNVDQHLAAILGERLGRIHNSYQTTGTGSSQPGGIQTGGSSGVTAVGTSTVTADELLDLLHSIDPAYRNPAFGAGWMFNDGSLKKLRQLKDGEGRPLWQAGIAVNEPNTLLGFPYYINQDMPAMTTGLKPVLFGALKKFKVRKVKGVTLLRLAERYAELHQVAFLAFTRMDSKVLDSGTDPIKYITMA